MSDPANNASKTTDVSPAEAGVKAAKFTAKAKFGLRATWYSYAALLLLFALNNALTNEGSLRFFFVQTVPLLIFIPGMVKQHHKTFSWLCFATLLYFTAYVAEVGAPNGTLSDALALALTVILFTSAMLTSRWIQHRNYFQWLATRNEH